MLSESLQHYRELVSLTDKTYRHGPSVPSASRRIPFLGGPGVTPTGAVYENTLAAAAIAPRAVLRQSASPGGYFHCLPSASRFALPKSSGSIAG